MRSFGTLLRHELKVSESYDPKVAHKRQYHKVVLPEKFDGRRVWKRYLSGIMDQGACGACYAYALISCMQDLYRLWTGNKVKPQLSVLEAVVCQLPYLNVQDVDLMQTDPSYRKALEARVKYTGCRKGNLYGLARYLFQRGAVEQSCVSDERIRSILLATNDLPTCDDISGSPHQHCDLQHNQDGVPIAQRQWQLNNFYIVSSNSALAEVTYHMQWAIFKYGPMVAGFVMFPDFLDAYDGLSVYTPQPNQTAMGGHAVKLVGWGQGYWIAANSWGTDWGEKGYFRIAMGHPKLRLEENHLGLIPSIPRIEALMSIKEHQPFSRSLIRTTDKVLRSRDPVNPRTLYSVTTTDMIQQGFLHGDLQMRIFTEKSLQSPPLPFPRRPWVFVMGTIISIIIIISLCILIITTKKKQYTNK